MSPDALWVPTFAVIGGGDDGAVYVRQLLRAVAAGRLVTERIRVVDRDPTCRASVLGGPLVRVEPAEWSVWLADHLGRLGSADHLVPYHWAPHLLLGWLEGEVRKAGGMARRGGALPVQGVPFERETASGDRALSYATWACPPTCIEPRLCPHTRGPKDWSLAAFLDPSRPGEELEGRIVFRCLHLVWGVGTIPVADVLSARDRVIGGLARGRRRYLVATSSHCHGLAASLDVSPRDDRAF